MISAFFKKLKGANKSHPTDEQDLVREYTEQKFLFDLSLTFWAYLVTVVICFVGAAGAIATAVFSKVSYGVMLAVATAVFYASVVGQILYMRLGFSYVSLSGALRITEVYGKRRDRIFIPRRLLWLEVTEIGEKAFCHASSAKIRTVHLPRTLKKIGKNAFDGCQSLSLICFEGSEQEWNAIEKDISLEKIEIAFGVSEGYPTKQKKNKDKKDKSKKKRKKNESKVANAAEKEE